jgi:hypothetical protein
MGLKSKNFWLLASKELLLLEKIMFAAKDRLPSFVLIVSSGP